MTDASAIQQSWARIEAWLGKKGKRILNSLGPAASAQQLLGFEQSLGLTLPLELRQSYRIHDGAAKAGLFPSSQPEDMAFNLLPLEQVREHLSSAAKWQGWQPGWLPLGSNGGGDYQCVDLSPGAGHGKLIQWQHATGSIDALATSWGARLLDLAEGLERKRYRYDADCGIIHPRPTDPYRFLNDARRFIALEASSPVAAPSHDRPPAEYENVLRLLDPARKTFGSASSRRMEALTVLGVSDAAKSFFAHFEPKRISQFRGLTFYPVPQVVEMNAPHWQPEARPFPLIIATTIDGRRLCLDNVLNYLDPPVTLYPADLDLKGKTKKQLQKAGTIVARHLLEFLQKLARNELSL